MNKRVKEFLDKSSNYEVIEYIGQLQQENKQLKEELKFTIGIVEHNRIISEKNKEIHQLKDNWNELKEYINRYIKYDKYGRKISKCLNAIVIMNKINKLEQGSDSNE